MERRIINLFYSNYFILIYLAYLVYLEFGNTPYTWGIMNLFEI